MHKMTERPLALLLPAALLLLWGCTSMSEKKENVVLSAEQTDDREPEASRFDFYNALYPWNDGVDFANDELILARNTAISVASYKASSGAYGSKTYYYANVSLFNRTDNTQITLTLDQLAYDGSASDEFTLSGKFNTRSSSVNPNGNPNTCTDLVNALMMHASFSGYDSMVKSAAVSALQGTDNSFTGGFTTATHTTKNKITCVNHFMIKTADLLSGAQISNIRLYKWGTHTYADYKKN